MSNERKEVLICSKCNKEFEVPLYDSINLDSDLELRDKLLLKNINTYICPHCNHINYYSHSILYYSIKNKFVVYNSNLLDIYNTYEMKDKIIKRLCIDSTDCIFTAADNNLLAKEKIIALENGLNHKLVLIYRLYIKKEINSYIAKRDYKDKCINSYLSYDNDYNLKILLILSNGKYIHYEFDYNYYKKISELYSDRINGTSDILFNDKIAERLINSNKYQDEINRSLKLNVAIVYGGFVQIPNFITEECKENDQIVFVDEKNNTYCENIKRIFKEMSYYELPADISYEFICKPLKSLEPYNDPNHELDNQELSKGLESYFKTKELPYDAIMNSKVILGLVSYISIPLKQYNNENKLDDGLLDNNCEYVKANIKEEFMVKNQFICIFSSYENAPKEVNGNPVRKIIYNFDDIIRFIIKSNEYYGILINPDKENILIDKRHLVENYLPDRIMTNDQRMINLLNNLTKEEKSYIGDKSYEYIRSIYIDGITPKKIADNMGLSPDKVGDMVSYGYQRLKRIIRANH